MNHRFLTGLALGAALLLIHGPARPLGLGEARVDSYLNQPLQATVRLLEASATDLESLTVVPAALADYERVGLSSEALTFGLEVTLDRRVTPPVARITSTRPVTDPVIQILLDARWSGGRMLREYTLFLDPPSIEAEPPPPRARISDPARERAAVSRVIGDTYGPVVSGDTLWSIANAYRADSALSMNQVMLAIVNRNPHAFRDGNVHHLLRGTELYMPGRDEIEAIDAADAAAIVAAHTAAWRDPQQDVAVPRLADAALPEESMPLPPESRDAPGTARVPEIVHRLELVPPEDEASGRGAAGLADDDAIAAQAALARAEEEMFAAQLEAEDLRARLDAMRPGHPGEAAGFALMDAELAAFEQSLRETRLAVADQAPGQGQAPIDAIGDEIAAYFASLDMRVGDGNAAIGADTIVQESASDLSGATAADPGAVSAGAAPEAAGRQDPVHWLREPASWGLLSGLVVLLSALAWLIMYQRAPAPAGTEDDRSAPGQGQPGYQAGGDAQVRREFEEPEFGLTDELEEELEDMDAVAGDGVDEDPEPRRSDGLPGNEIEWSDPTDVYETVDDLPADVDDDSGIADIFTLDDDDADVKLDLARAYVSMEDVDAARAILNEVLDEGNPDQRKQARELLERI